MVEAGERIDGPVILGSCGMAGGNRNLDWMIDVAKEVFDELGVKDRTVAVIRSELDPASVIREFRAGALRPTGAGPELDAAALEESTIVGQMGVHPLITALDSGAKYVLAGRSCDIALFASDMIRRGIDPGLAYHVGHVLECGALACDPGSPSDCLAMEHTEFFARDARTAGIHNSQFVRAGKPWPWSIKLEGARRLGKRKVSLVHLDPADLPRVPADVLVYGRNGVQTAPLREGEAELGLIVETCAATPQAAETLASLLTHYLIHYGYAGRKATAGNIAYPLSPNLVSFQREDGQYGAVVPSGTRDPVFQANYPMIKDAVLKLVQAEFPDALRAATWKIHEADASRPVALVRTIDRDAAQLAQRHQADLKRLLSLAPARDGSRLNMDAGDAYEWTLYHLLQNEDIIKNRMFPITYFRINGAAWTESGSGRPRYADIGITGYEGNLDDRTLSLIADVPPAGTPQREQPLLDMAVVVRSKDAGINRLTFDIVFNSAADYEAALRSNVFCAANVAHVLGVAPERVVGTFFVDSCNAIKLTIDRPNISASPDERDVFGAQQQGVIERLSIPHYAERLAMASAL